MECPVAAGLAAALAATSVGHKPFLDPSLTGKQKAIRTKIVKERGMIYATSLVLGMVVAYSLKYSGCKALAFTLGLAHILYILYPKSTMMLKHLTSEQVPLWVKGYRSMSVRYYLAMLIVFIVYVYTK